MRNLHCKKPVSRWLGSKISRMMRYRCVAALMQYTQRFFYIRFYGGHLYLRPLFLERQLHSQAENHIKFLKEKAYKKVY